MTPVSETPALYRAGDGPTVLLLHGLTASWRVWSPVLPGLAETFSVIAPTLPGHSGGPHIRVQEPFRLGQLTDWVERWLDGLGLGAVHVVGNSMGGGLAVDLAVRGRALSVVAFAPGFDWPVDDPARRSVARGLRKAHALTRRSLPIVPLVMRSARLRRTSLARTMERGDLMPPAEAVAMARAAADCAVAEVISEGIASGTAIVEHLDRVRVPTLIAWPEHDYVAPRETRSRLEGDIPGVTARTLPGVGHIPMYDNAPLVVDTIREWITAATRSG